MEYAKILSDKMKDLGMTKQQISDLSGVPYMTVSRILKNGAARAGTQNVLSLCQALDVDPNSFTNMADASKNAEKVWVRSLADAYSSAIVPTQKNVCKLLDIPHIVPEYYEEEPEEEEEEVNVLIHDLPSAAGSPIYISEDYTRRSYPASKVQKGTDFAVPIKGDSMEPEILNGSIVFVHAQPDLDNGQIGIFVHGNEAVCKRYTIDDLGALLKSDNSKRPSIRITEETEGFRIIGRVIGSFEE